ncbi:phosphonate C-P lyase system protein PhnH [Mesorhizobium tianshanense]|uniref:phosphonate C-P lyase system protein PhnH n=1 Tax=Mesorhizobium tianshanense TaxID=39844 RepID=UPI0013906F2B|nr:phosphonate C-P lyase system protein PhnH [Mesorhizobium tianshanense]
MIAESLLDRECTFCVESDQDLDRAFAITGARRVPLAEANYVFAPLATAEEVARQAVLRIGTLAYPDEAATLFAPVRFGFGQELRLTGPGIKDSLTDRDRRH